MLEPTFRTSVLLSLAIAFTQSSVSLAQGVIPCNNQISGNTSVSPAPETGSGYGFKTLNQARLLTVTVTVTDFIAGNHAFSLSNPTATIRKSNNCALDITPTSVTLNPVNPGTFKGSAQVPFIAGQNAFNLGRGTTYACDFVAEFNPPTQAVSEAGACGTFTRSISAIPGTIQWFRK